jgi:molybdopterin-biosynthesis enzyme MoeA-like protein/nicotinamide mononucleotide (NMN) deamidase PncC
LTREALAKVAGVELVLDETSLEHIRGMFARHGRDMPERNRLQAFFPAGSVAIFNPRGTAPGVAIEVSRHAAGTCHVFALPGVPAEMFEMFGQTVSPAITKLLPNPRVIRHRRIKCFGLGESQVEQMLPDLIRRGREPQVGITVHAATITLRVTSAGASVDECDQLMQPTLEMIRSALGTLIFGEEDEELPDVVARLLAERREGVATIEVGSGGVLGQWLTEVLNADGVFVGGMVLKDAQAQRGAWDDTTQIEAPDGQQGRQLVVHMAERIRNRFSADYGLAIGAFPSESASDQPPQPYWYALATPQKTLIRSGTLISHPAIWKPRAAKQALNLLRLWLLNGDGPENQ